MKTKAVRLYGKNDLRLEEFELPPITDEEILALIISDSICMSSYKAAIQGADHKRVPSDISTNPVIIGHEFCGEIVEVGKRWQSEFSPGQKFSIQPALNYKGSLDAPGYSFQYIGGNATYIIVPREVMEMKCLLVYEGDAYFFGSLAEPMSCIVGAFHASYHTKPGEYYHEMGIRDRGNLAILAGAGPMGLGAIDYVLQSKRKPNLFVVTDIDQDRLARAGKLFPTAHAAKKGISLKYIQANQYENIEKHLLSLTGNSGFDDVFVFAPIAPVVQLADRILARGGCLNFFAGPADHEFRVPVNFYNIHYGSTHIMGTSGGNTDDIKESLRLMEKGRINPAVMVTHVGGLDSAVNTTMNLPKIPGGKKLIYTTIDMELTALTDFEEKGKTDPLFRDLAGIIKQNNDLWCYKAEQYLLKAKGGG